MKIIELTAENFKKLKAVQFCPQDNAVQITGANEQGKSSVPDMITGITESGVYIMSNDNYHMDPCAVPSLSRGTICQIINQTPAHVFAGNKRLNPRYVPANEKEDKFDIGSAAHSLFLEGYNIVDVVFADDWRKKEAQEKRAEIRAAGKIPMLEKHFDNTHDMVKAAHTQLAETELGIKDLHAEGKSEETFIWTESLEETDLYKKPTGEVITDTWCRCRTDWRSNDFTFAFDFKTTDSASPEAFNRKVCAMGYDIQRVWYPRGMKAAANLDKAPRFYFVVIEVKPPYLLSVIRLEPAYIELGKSKMDFGIYQWRKCLTTGEWPGYPKRICEIEPPSWELAKWESLSSTIGEE